MSANPDNNIESELKNFARQRRIDLGRPQRMPAAMREELLREVKNGPAPVVEARAAAPQSTPAPKTTPVEPPQEIPPVEARPRPQKDSGRPAWLGFWPQLILRGAVIALLVTLAIVRWGHGEKEPVRQLARQTAPEENLLDLKDAAPGQNRSAGNEKGEQHQILQRVTRQLATDHLPSVATVSSAPARAAEKPAAAPEESGDLKKKGSLQFNEKELVRLETRAATDSALNRRYALAPKSAPPTDTSASHISDLLAESKIAPATPEPAQAGLGDAATVATKFANAPAPQPEFRFQQAAVYRRNYNSPPPPPVMTNFTLEQTSDELRVIDADGSVYAGKLVAAPTSSLGFDVSNVNGNQYRKAQAQAQQAGANIYYFSLTGTNQTLNELVKVEASYIPNPGQPVVAGAQLNLPALKNQAASSQAANNQSSNNQSLPLSNNALIQGRVTIGKKDQILLNAVPANSQNAE